MGFGVATNTLMEGLLPAKVWDVLKYIATIVAVLSIKTRATLIYVSFYCLAMDFLRHLASATYIAT